MVGRVLPVVEVEEEEEAEVVVEMVDLNVVSRVWTVSTRWGLHVVLEEDEPGKCTRQQL